MVENRNEKGIEESGSEERWENEVGDGSVNLIWGEMGAEGEGNEWKRRGKRGDENGIERVEGRGEESLREWEVVLLREEIVVCEKEDWVRGRDWEEGDERGNVMDEGIEWM